VQTGPVLLFRKCVRFPAISHIRVFLHYCSNFPDIGAIDKSVFPDDPGFVVHRLFH
jgi:hypothetical protein